MLNLAVNQLFDHALNAKLQWFDSMITSKRANGTSIGFYGHWRQQWKDDIGSGAAPYDYLCDLGGEGLPFARSQMRRFGWYLGTSESMTPRQAQHALFAAGFNDNSAFEKEGTTYMLALRSGV